MSIAAATILRLFREAGNSFVSGAVISRELKVSRTAVWKYINILRDIGYRIEAVPSRGYQLISTPDILSEEEVRERLQTAVIGRNLVCISETLSTNSDAFRLAELGAEDPGELEADAEDLFPRFPAVVDDPGDFLLL